MGNVTEDRVGRSWQPGGPSLYSARAALALGWDVTLVTNLPPSFDPTSLAGLTVVSARVDSAPRFENRYDPAGRRSQRLLHPGLPIGPALLERVAHLSPNVLFLAPAFHEVAGWPPLAAGLRGVALQGILRRADAEQRVEPVRDPSRRAAPFALPGVAVFFSDEDVRSPGLLARRLSGRGATVSVTHGARGVSVYTAETRRDRRALPASEVDPTGAGDCYATAFLVRLAETGDLEQAIGYGLAAGAVSVETRGTGAVPTREQVESRLGRAAA